VLKCGVPRRRVDRPASRDRLFPIVSLAVGDRCSLALQDVDRNAALVAMLARLRANSPGRILATPASAFRHTCRIEKITILPWRVFSQAIFIPDHDLPVRRAPRRCPDTESPPRERFPDVFTAFAAIELLHES